LIHFRAKIVDCQLGQLPALYAWSAALYPCVATRYRIQYFLQWFGAQVPLGIDAPKRVNVELSRAEARQVLASLHRQYSGLVPQQLFNGADNGPCIALVSS